MIRHRGARPARVLGLLLLFVAVLAGCNSDSDKASGPPPATDSHSYVGTVQGTDAFVAVVVDGSRVQAYVCDGIPGEPEGTVPTTQLWFNGPSDGGVVEVNQPGADLELQLTDSGMNGTLTLADGRRAPVTGQLVTGDAGLYRAEAASSDGKAVAGWILAVDGQQRGGVGGEGSLAKASGTRVLNPTQPTFSLQGLATARVAKVGITPIPIP